MKKLLGLCMMLILAVATAACGQAAQPTATEAPKTQETTTAAPATEQASEELTIKHKLGETKVKKNPKNVVVFDFGALDTLDKLGVEVLGVAQQNVPPYLEKYKDAKYQPIGSVKEPDFEKINALKPELILISGRQQESYEELSKIAPTVFIGVDTTKFMESFTTNMKTLGQIFGKEAEVDAELSKLEASIKEVSEKVKAADKKALIILANDTKVSAYGAGSRFGLIHDVLGFKQADDKIEVSTHGQSISFEYVVEKDPDYLFVVDSGAITKGSGGAAPAKQVVENELVKGTKAFKEGHVVYLDPYYWYLSGGGLVSVQGMVDEISAAVK